MTNERLQLANRHSSVAVTWFMFDLLHLNFSAILSNHTVKTMREARPPVLTN